MRPRSDFIQCERSPTKNVLFCQDHPYNESKIQCKFCVRFWSRYCPLIRQRRRRRIKRQRWKHIQIFSICSNIWCFALSDIWHIQILAHSNVHIHTQIFIYLDHSNIWHVWIFATTKIQIYFFPGDDFQIFWYLLYSNICWHKNSNIFFFQVTTLRSAIEYINSLQSLLDDCEAGRLI